MKRLDLRGEVCPYTFVRTRLWLEELAMGEILIVTLDHEPASRSVPRALCEWGQEIVSILEEDGVWQIEVRKTVE